MATGPRTKSCLILGLKAGLSSYDKLLSWFLSPFIAGTPCPYSPTGALHTSFLSLPPFHDYEVSAASLLSPSLAYPSASQQSVCDIAGNRSMHPSQPSVALPLKNPITRNAQGGSAPARKLLHLLASLPPRPPPCCHQSHHPLLLPQSLFSLLTDFHSGTTVKWSGGTRKLFCSSRTPTVLTTKGCCHAHNCLHGCLIGSDGGICTAVNSWQGICPQFVGHSWLDCTTAGWKSHHICGHLEQILATLSSQQGQTLWG